MFEGDCTSDEITTLIFLPTEVDKIKCTYLHGEINVHDKTVTVYITDTCSKRCSNCLGVYSARELNYESGKADSWIHLERQDDRIILRKYIVQGDCKNTNYVGVVIIHYDREIFTQCNNSLLTEGSEVAKRDHFRKLIDRLKSPKKESVSVLQHLNRILQFVRFFILILSFISKKLFFITKCSSVGFHIDNYLDGLLWFTDCRKGTKRDHIKKMNFLLSVILDVFLGAIFLNYLTTWFSPDSFAKFLLSAEKAIQSLRDLIHWLTGDPAGFKLNFTFSKMLATFFLFYIDIWCSFIAILRPMYNMIFMVFLFMGKAGITFQVSVMADILAVVTFHIYCICLFAARLYNIQVFGLIALWRLFLGRKRNPLRDRVDSCKYTPEQLFIGTLGFTILLFLLPTTLIYYVVFTFLRIILTIVSGSLVRIRYFILSLQLYSTVLWLVGSPKVCAGIQLTPKANRTSRPTATSSPTT
ncbi:UNVERIFIED_CONTAM: hypothetical protein PYX00_000576 [Menopon gallinae]|uniref:Phosphatidylinositol N-acetylglucosaminyltransferase subunit Q n=1 Tax=Menopon gallinae TaxID=328185 RepID=A0AAW2I9M3_9NEOP